MIAGILVLLGALGVALHFGSGSEEGLDDVDSPMGGPDSASGARRETGLRTDEERRESSGQRIFGRLVDEEGHGLPGAPVRLRFELPNGQPAPDRLPDPVSVETGDSGEFEFTDLAGFWRVTVVAAPKGLCSVRARAHLQPNERLDLGHLVARAGAEVDGQVTDADGNPVPGARVVIAAIARRMGNAGGISFFSGLDPDFRQIETTDDDGRFRCIGLRPGKLNAVVTAAGFSPGCLRDIIVDDLESKVSVDIELKRERVLRGTVRRANGDVIADALVSIVVSGFNPSDAVLTEHTERETRSGPEGAFQFAQLPRRYYRLTIARPGCVTRDGIDISPDQDEIDVTLETSGLVYGFLRRDSDGAAVTDFKLSTESLTLRAYRSAFPAQLLTGDDAARVLGIASKPNLFAAVGLCSPNVHLAFEAPGLTSGSIRVDELQPDERREVDVVLAPEVELAGLVLSTTGRPIVGARVTAKRTDYTGRNTAAEKAFASGNLSAIDPLRGFSILQPMLEVVVFADEAGHFEFPGLVAGRYSVNATDPSFLPTGPQEFQIDPETPIDDIEFQLRPGGRITGRVIGVEGRSALAVRVRLQTATPAKAAGNPVASRIFSRVIAEAWTDGQGQYDIVGIPSGSYELIASAENEQSVAVAISAAVKLRVKAGKESLFDLRLLKKGD